jgi:hypothetical protein
MGNFFKFLVLILEVYRQVEKLGGVLWLEKLKAALDEFETADTDEKIYDSMSNISKLLRLKKNV